MRSLIDEVARSIVAPAAKKRLFIPPHLPFVSYLGCYEVAFETGVVLGYSFRDRLATFAELFSQPGREQELVTFLQELAAQHLTEVGEPKGFIDLALRHEESRIKAKWRESGINEAQIDYLTKHHRMPLEQALKNAGVAVSTGIGLGSAFPEMTERLWKVVYESPMNRDEWQRWRKAGLDVGDEVPEPLPLARRQEQLLLMVESFVSVTRPELLPQFKSQR